MYDFVLFRLEAGKFDSNLLQNIQSSRNFILVLTFGALDRCMNDTKQKDWIHKEVVCALNSNCTIIPVFEKFSMPKSEDLPITMRPLTFYNGVNWVHEYQTASMDKIVRFMKIQSIGMKKEGLKNESNDIEITQKENNCTIEIERADPEGMENEVYVNEL